MSIIKLKSKRNNSELSLDNEIINISQTNFPHNILVLKLKNERKNLKDRIKSAYNIILKYLTDVLKKQEKEKEILIKEYNQKDKYINDMLNFNIKSFLQKWFGENKFKCDEEKYDKIKNDSL